MTRKNTKTHIPTVLFWPFRFRDMKETWRHSCAWTAAAFRKYGYRVLKHGNFICVGIEVDGEYQPEKPDQIKYADIVIYNHTDRSKMKDDLMPTAANLHFKPCPPTNRSTGLDTIGYGPYSSISLQKPDFEKVPASNVKRFFGKKIADLKKARWNKWGKTIDSPHLGKLPAEYHLVLHQIPTDEVAIRHDFGDYNCKLRDVLSELSANTDIPIVVKLHPRLKDKANEAEVKRIISTCGDGIMLFSGRADIHPFLEKAKIIWTANSGAGIEALMHQKPMVTWGWPEYHWVTENVKYLADIGRIVESVDDWHRPDLQAKWLYWYMEKWCYYNQKTANRRVKEILDEIGWPGVK